MNECWVRTRIAIFWDVTRCYFWSGSRRFERTE